MTQETPPEGTSSSGEGGALQLPTTLEEALDLLKARDDKFADVQSSRDKTKEQNRKLQEELSQLREQKLSDIFSELSELRSKAQAAEPPASGDPGGDSEFNSLRTRNQELEQQLEALKTEQANSKAERRREAIEGKFLLGVPEESRAAAKLVLRGMASSLDDDGKAEPEEIANKALDAVKKQAPQLFQKSNPDGFPTKKAAPRGPSQSPTATLKKVFKGYGGR